MAIWAIADIHASRVDPETGRPEKPMDIFGGVWADHLDRLQQAWRETVAEGDTVIVAGDIDWAVRLEDARETLECLEHLPGFKILIRGNHDYWWSSKTTNRVRQALPPSIAVIHNDALQVEGVNICGAKGSPVPGGPEWSDQDAKILNREVGRLRLSLDARDRSLPTIVALHYPPFYRGHEGTQYQDLISEAGVRVCVFGHLHGDAARSAPQGEVGGTRYILVAGDALAFRPMPIASDGG